MSSRLLTPLRLLGTLALLLATCGYARADDPPSEVARLNDIQGQVTFAPSGSDDWSYAPLNRPMTSGDQIWVDQNGHAELHIGSTALRLASQTSAAFLALNDQATQIRLTQGSANLRVRTLFDGQHVEIATPDLAFVIDEPGSYRVDVDPNSGTTRITVWQGSGTALGAASNSYKLRAGDRVTYAGQDLGQQAAEERPVLDGFDQWAQQRDWHEDRSASARYVSREITGYETLDDNGTWQDTPDYGAVWVPRAVNPGWAPYRNGHWVWVNPWGWTWVDDAPWGFAPFHYGRWAYWHSNWCWVPGPRVVRPVYAPALVAFAGGGGININISVGHTSPGVAWFPLAPGEIYRPAYAVSPGYVTNLNRNVVVNHNTVIINNNTVNNTTINKTVYVNSGVPNAISAIPANTFAQGRPVQGGYAPIAVHQLSGAQFGPTPLIKPTGQAMGGGRPAPVPAAVVAAANRPVVVSRQPPVQAVGASHGGGPREIVARQGGQPAQLSGQPAQQTSPAPVQGVQAAVPQHAIQPPAGAGPNHGAPRPPMQQGNGQAQAEHNQAVAPVATQAAPARALIQQSQPAQSPPQQPVQHVPSHPPVHTQDDAHRGIPVEAQQPAQQSAPVRSGLQPSAPHPMPQRAPREPAEAPRVEPARTEAPHAEAPRTEAPRQQPAQGHNMPHPPQHEPQHHPTAPPQEKHD